MLTATRALTALALALLAPCIRGMWVLGTGPLVQDRLDPIISPGAVTGHVHTVVGASGFGPVLDPGEMMASACTTMAVQADKSNYWVPQLYHHAANGSFTRIPLNYASIYYLQRPDSRMEDILAFPAGLRMLAGDPYATAPVVNAPRPGSGAVSFVCLDYGGGGPPQGDAFPAQNCRDGLRAQVTFPSCWDGRNLDADDHKSHMAYPEDGRVDGGDCPASHPKKTITLFTEWVFAVGDFDYQQGKKNWVLANGDDVGYGFHADFVNGWDQEVLQDAIDQCTTNLFQNVKGCPPFVPSIDEDLAKNCTIARVVDEEIDGPLEALPGCNPIPAKKGAQCPGYTPPKIKGQ